MRQPGPEQEKALLIGRKQSKESLPADLLLDADAGFLPHMTDNSPESRSSIPTHMRIAVLSDSHDHIPNLKRAVLRANQEKAELLIHCGDLISPFMLPILELFNGPIHAIYGNNGGDQHLIASRCALASSRIEHHGTHGTLVADSLRIAIEHYPRWAHALAGSGKFDLVCFGHTHIFHTEQVGNCILVNPGELLGKDSTPTFALLETNDGCVRKIEVGEKLIFDD